MVSTNVSYPERSTRSKYCLTLPRHLTIGVTPIRSPSRYTYAPVGLLATARYPYPVGGDFWYSAAFKRASVMGSPSAFNPSPEGVWGCAGSASGCSGSAVDSGATGSGTGSIVGGSGVGSVAVVVSVSSGSLGGNGSVMRSGSGAPQLTSSTASTA